MIDGIGRRFVALAALLAAGTATARGVDAPRLTAAWSVQISEPAGVTRLVPSAGRVVAVTWAGEVVVLDAATGKRLWRKTPRLQGAVDQVSVAADGERVIATWPGEARVVAYELASGREVWSTPLEAPPTGMVDCARHRAVVATHRGQGTLVATAIDPKSGARLWQSPVEGPVVGAGDDHVFTETPSGFGAWPGRLGAVHCGTGAVRALGTTDRKLVRFLAAGDGVALARHLDANFAREALCVHQLGQDAPPTCLPTTDGEVPAHSIAGALVEDGVIYLSTAHIMAHNLDPSPDSWIFAMGLDGAHRWRSAPLLSGGAPVDAGSLLLTGFGSTGADDFAYLVDPKDGAPVGRLPLRTAPNTLAADAERMYVATYDGRVYGVLLPRPGPSPVARKTVAAEGEAAARAKPDAGPWRTVAVIDAHPRTARSSGSSGPGRADPVAFLDAAGAQVVVGGNDDRVRVLDASTGAQRWISQGMGKDVEAVQVGGGRIHVRVYGGRSFTYIPRADRWRQAKAIEHGNGWMSGLTADGARMVADTFDGTLRVYDAASGALLFAEGAKSAFDQRGVRVVDDRVVIHADGALRVLSVGGSALAPVASRAMPLTLEGRGMVQAWMVDETHGAWEWCGPSSCVVEIGPLIGDGRTVRHTLDVRGAGWSPTVPSTLAVSPDRAWLFFFRLGIPPALVEVKSGRIIPLSAITGEVPAEYTGAAFSADGRRLVLGMHPKPWQVTVIER